MNRESDKVSKVPLAFEGKAKLKLMNKSKMALSVIVLAPAFLLLLVQGARSEECTPASVEVLQTSNGEKAGVDTVFEVMVRNRCECAVRGVVLSSEGFSSSLPVDPKLFRKEGNGYLVRDGRLIQSGAVVQFRYAWDRAFEIGPLAVQEDCSGLHEFTM